MQPKTLLITTVMIGGAALAIATLNATSLVMDGDLVSSRVKVIDGESWVPVRDLAKAKHMDIAMSGDTITLSSGGGANQLNGFRGKIGEMVMTGNWRFKIASFTKVDSYTLQTSTTTDYSVYHAIADNDDRKYTPKPGYDMYIASCTLKNARTAQEQFDWNPTDNHSAIADTTGTNHPWIAFDIESPAFNSKPLLPGAAIDFAICYIVKKGSVPQDIVVTLKSLTDSAGQTVRITAPSAPAELR